MASETETRSGGVVQEANERLKTGLDKCRTLFSECRQALADGTAEPSIFKWSEDVRTARSEIDKGLDPNGQSRN